MQTVIVDYGVGNLASVRLSLERLGEEPVIASTPDQIIKADRVLLPGVGAAGSALTALRKNNLDQALEEVVKEKGRPILGICVGMQMFADRLYEFGDHRGLGWIKGEVIELRQAGLRDLKIPHMGWNALTVSESEPNFFKGTSGEKRFYFCHSYTFKTHSQEGVVATCQYGTQLVVAINIENILAVQFHPEKSQRNGQKFLECFLDWTP